MRYYATKFTQIVHIKEDPKVDCNNYEKDSYDDCDIAFIDNYLKKNYPADFVPIWATSNYSHVTSLIKRTWEFDDLYEEIVSGSEDSG